VAQSNASRSCADCNFSLRLEPTNKEIKAGYAEARMYCCKRDAALQIGKETAPQLAEIVREGLCGAAGIWWAPVLEEIAGAIISSDSATEKRARREAAPYLRPHGKPVRQPYKVETK